ncbi:MAG: hypothetical protein H7839_04230 [Magnetococcus sp. YQC-5]
MDRFARLFTLQLQLGHSSRRHAQPRKDEPWHALDRTIILFGPPAIVNQAWSIGMMDLLSEEETEVELID